MEDSEGSTSAVAQSTPVVIVGGGPVGLGLAVELGQRGIRSVLVEAYELPQPIPKGQNLTQRTMEHFWFWGVEEDVRAAAPIPLEFGIGGAAGRIESVRGLVDQWR